MSEGECLTIQKLSHDGRGLAHTAQGKVVFVANALPNEQVQIKITAQHDRYDEAELLSIANPSAHRIAPPCPHFDDCGGCQLQYASYPHQLELKQQTVAEQIEKSCQLQSLPWQAPIASREYEYRRRIRLAIAPRTRHLGFRAKRSKDIIPIHDCWVAAEPLRPLIGTLQELLKGYPAIKTLGHLELGINDVSATEAVPYLLVRSTRALSPAQRDIWQAWQTEHNVQVVIQDNESEQLNYFKTLDGVNEIEFGYFTQGKRLKFGPNEFIQVNRGVNEQMVQQAIAWLNPSPTDSVLELFAGFGNFTFALAPQVCEVTAVEGAALQVSRGEHNAAAFGFENTRFIQSDLASESAVKMLQQSLDYQAVLLDPPRAGALSFCRLGAQIKASRILYVSCNPDTLARDLKYLLEGGYTIEKISIIDMFAQTAHIETMVLLKRTGKAENND